MLDRGQRGSDFHQSRCMWELSRHYPVVLSSDWTKEGRVQAVQTTFFHYKHHVQDLLRQATGEPYGFCAPLKGHSSREAQSPKGDCTSGAQGVWQLESLDPCVGHCRSCDRCNFVSFSRDAGECVWYHSCDLENLAVKGNGETYMTLRVDRGVQSPQSLDALRHWYEFWQTGRRRRM
uniref:Uncharacterized protein n=1 Tax=Haptolina ericina TaxID=156174 RepID=A0A7S3AJG0_9EUKA